MAGLTPLRLLEQIIAVCTQRAIVTAYAVRDLDPDVLSMRIHLVDGSFIEVFHNAATSRTAFALIVDKQRVYGKDNAKMGWHVHPADNPLAHIPCDPVSFEAFLAEVEALRFPQTRP